jgi:hypothetical protein
MLETYELFIVGMLNQLKLVNITKNLYYFMNFGKMKTKITAYACVVNCSDYIN